MLASLEDIIRSKKAAGRLRDTAVMPILEMTLAEKNSATDVSKNEEE